MTFENTEELAAHLQALVPDRALLSVDIEELAVLGHFVGDTRLMGGSPPQAVWGRS